MTGTSLWVKTDEPLLWLGGAGHETWLDPSYLWDCQRRKDRPHYVLQLTLSGACFHERGGNRTLISQGKAFLDSIPGDFVYGYPPERKDPYEQVYVTMTGPIADGMCRQLIDEFGHVLSFGRESPIETMMLSIAHQHAAGTMKDRYQISGRLYQLLMAVMSTRKAAQVTTSSLLGNAISMVDRHSSDHQFNVSGLAKALDCSREHVTRQFRQATGVSAGDYITQHRLGTAARLLRQGNRKLAVIAEQSGFASANYLCRAFRKRYGVTPSQFRRTPWLVTE